LDALILCGGFATRLEPLTLFVPKPLLPIKGRPILDYIVEKTIPLGVNRIVISTNLKFADQFEYWRHHTLSDGINKQIDMVVEPSMHNGEKFGAVKGINYALEAVKFNEDLLIIAGDNYYDFDLRALFAQFSRNRKPIIAAFDIGSLEEAKRFGVIIMEDGKVKEFQEKPENPKSTLVSTGIYIYPKEMLPKFHEYVANDNNPDAPGYFLSWLMKSTEIECVVYKGNWYDVGNIDTYKKVYDHMED
jgi:glucose-1-phosphate thymidylyltransferase